VWVFSFITFLGVITQASNTCTPPPLSQSAHSAISTAQEQYQSFQYRDLDQGNQQNSDCHHGGPECRNCHLGHCAFVLSSSVYFSVSDLAQIINFTNMSVVIFEFQASPFRPPIA